MVVRRFGLGVGLSGCSSDPGFWNSVATGLNDAADQMAWENANCYWGPLPGQRYGMQQRYCPGDYGYAPPIALPASYYRDRLREDRRGDGTRRRKP